MTLKVAKLAGISEARHIWQQMLDSDAYATFFSSPPWLETWWEHHSPGHELLLLQVLDQNTPVGFAPLMLHTVLGCQCVSFLGTGLSDYADILVNEAQASRYEVVAAIMHYLATSFPTAIFDLQEIPEGTPTLAHIQAWLRTEGITFHVAVQDVCPILHLPDTAEAFHKHLKKSFLADIRRGERRLCERGTVTIVDHVRPADGNWTALRDQMADLQSQRMRTKGQVPMWQGPLGDFVKDVLQRADHAGSLRVTGLYLDGQMIAYELCFLHSHTMYAWSRAFAEEHRNTGPGKIALLHLLETAISEGYQIFDLLRGEEPYKALWTDGLTHNYRVVFVIKPSLRTRMVYRYITQWREQLKTMTALRKLYRAVKAVRGGAK